MKTLTKRQGQLLAFIEDHIVTNGYPPSIREMGEHMGIRSTNGVNDHLKALERDGYIIRRARMKSRAIVLTDRASHRRTARRPGAHDEGTVSVPILGRVAAGQPILAEENLEGQLQVDRTMLGGSQNVFALRVQGDSMIEKGILAGDIVFVRKQNNADSGQVVVAMIEGEATVKTFRPQKDRIVFEPANQDMDPIVVRHSDSYQTEILGIGTGVFRRLH